MIPTPHGPDTNESSMVTVFGLPGRYQHRGSYLRRAHMQPQHSVPAVVGGRPSAQVLQVCFLSEGSTVPGACNFPCKELPQTRPK